MVAEIVGVSTRYTVAVDVAAMEREGASEYGRGWSVASLQAVRRVEPDAPKSGPGGPVEGGGTR